MSQGLMLAIWPTDVGPLMSSLCQVPFRLQDASRQDQQAALYNSTCVHASFGDLELAQMTLRGVVTAPNTSF